jgi:hypothetical protein
MGLAACKALARRNAHAAIRVSFGSLMVQRDQWDTSWGPKKLIFLIREIDDATMTAASMEFCRFVVLRSLGGRSGVGKIHVQSPTPHARALSARDTSAKMHLKPFVCSMKCQGFGSRALWRAPSTAACGVSDYPTPDLPRETSKSRSTSEKSKEFGPDGAPSP